MRETHDMTASEALRRARATMACMGEGSCMGSYDCAFWSMWEYDSPTFDPNMTGAPGGQSAQVHPAHASLLLDGFSVDEITEAGG